MEKGIGKFIPIAVSSKFSICGLPIRVDTYSTCSFGCEYCEANCRTIMKKSTDLKVGDIDYIRRLLNRIENGQVKDNDLLATLIKSGVTWHCGGMSDPFQPVEKELGITKQLVDLSNEKNIHILFSTKSDTVYRTNINPENAAFQLSITNLDNRKDLEPGVPDIAKRIEFYRILKKEGFKVGIRIQPFIPNVSTLDIVKEFYDADNFTLEGLKLVPQNKEHKEHILNLLGMSKDEFFLMGLLNLKPDIRKAMYVPFIEYFESHQIPFSIADNDMHDIGSNLCCCGDNLVRNPTTFNSTALSHIYGKWSKEQVDNEICKAGICDCKCKSCFASNRTEDCTTVKEFYDKRFFRSTSTFSPEYILNYSNKGKE